MFYKKPRPARVPESCRCMEQRRPGPAWKPVSRANSPPAARPPEQSGFSSLSMIASCSRNDQAVLMACTHSPNHRYNMIHRLEEEILLGSDGHSPGKRVFLSSQDFQCHEKREEGFRVQTGFVYEDCPVWSYLAEGVEVVRTVALMQGRNTVGVSYRIRNRSKSAATLRVRRRRSYSRRRIPPVHWSSDNSFPHPAQKFSNPVCHIEIS